MGGEKKMDKIVIASAVAATAISIAPFPLQIL